MGSAVGLAYVGTMCTKSVAIGLTQDGGELVVNSVGAIAAHELGHIFNMAHDDFSKYPHGHAQAHWIFETCT